MSNEAIWDIGLLVLGVFLGSILGHWSSRLRFLGERSWERQALVYDNIIDGLASMIHSLNSWMEKEHCGVYSQEALNVITREFDKARIEIEYAMIKGENIISEKALNALSDLVESLKSAPREFAGSSAWASCLQTYHEEARSCLEVIRAEARSRLPGYRTNGR